MPCPLTPLCTRHICVWHCRVSRAELHTSRQLKYFLFVPESQCLLRSFCGDGIVCQLYGDWVHDWLKKEVLPFVPLKGLSLLGWEGFFFLHGRCSFPKINLKCMSLPECQWIKRPFSFLPTLPTKMKKVPLLPKISSPERTVLSPSASAYYRG